MSSILTIRLGALGDLAFCFQAFHEIRAAHPDAQTALLTRAPFAAFARKMPWFDEVIIDTHPTFAEPSAWLDLLKKLKAFAPTRIYDLQGKRRQTVLYTLLRGPFGPEWSGAAPLCKFPRLWPPLPGMSFTGFLSAQLRAAGVPQAPPVDLKWLDAPVDKFQLPGRYVTLIPGCSPDSPHKRWPARSYAALANKFHEQQIDCVVVGTRDDKDAISEIKSAAPQIVDFCGQTDLFELAGILRKAIGVVGNDTGPLHMAAALGLPTLALFGARSNPVWSKPPGPLSAVLQHPVLSELDADAVLTAFDVLLKHAESTGRQGKSRP